MVSVGGVKLRYHHHHPKPVVVLMVSVLPLYLIKGLMVDSTSQLRNRSGTERGSHTMTDPAMPGRGANSHRGYFKENRNEANSEPFKHQNIIKVLFWIQSL